MLKLITKINCKRCEEVKEYLTQNSIQFELEQAEDKGYAYWRDLVQEKTGKFGFPILINNEQIINGSTEEIISSLPEKKYFWAE